MMVKFKWEQIVTMLSQQEGRVPAILDPGFTYANMRKRKIIVISDEHAGTYDPDPKTGETMYTSMADRMKKTGNYEDIVDFGDRCLDFDVIALKISKFRSEVEESWAASGKGPSYVGTVHMFWSMLDSNGDPIQPTAECDAAWGRLAAQFQKMELRVYVTMNYGASILVDDHGEGARKFKQWAVFLTQTMEKVAIVDKGLRFWTDRALLAPDRLRGNSELQAYNAMVDHYVLRQQVLLNLTTRKHHWRGDGTKGDKSMNNMASRLLCSLKHQGEGKLETDEMVPQVCEEEEEKAEVLLEDVVDLTGEDEQMDRPDFNLDQGEPDLRRFWVQEDDCDIFFLLLQKANAGWLERHQKHLQTSRKMSVLQSDGNNRKINAIRASIRCNCCRQFASFGATSKLEGH